MLWQACARTCQRVCGHVTCAAGRKRPTFQTPGRRAYRGLAPRILFCPQVPPSSPAKTHIDVVIADAFLLSPVEARGQGGNTSGVKSGHPEPHSRLEAPPGSFPTGDRGLGVFACRAGCMRCLCLQLGSVRRGTRVTHFAGSQAQCEGTPMSRLNKPASFLCTRPKPLRQGEARRGAEGDGPAGGPRGSAMRTGEQTSDVRVGCGLRAPGHWSQASEQLSWGRKQMGFGNAGGGHVTTCPSGAFPCHHYTDAGPKGETEAPSPRRLGQNPDTRSRVLCVTRKPWPPSAARL